MFKKWEIMFELRCLSLKLKGKYPQNEGLVLEDSGFTKSQGLGVTELKRNNADFKMDVLKRYISEFSIVQ